MNRVNWLAITVFGFIVVIVFLVGLSLFGGWGYGNWGMMGPGMMGGWGYGTFSWIGMIFMWLIPISFLVLTVLGIVWLVKAITGGVNRSTLPSQSCPGCGKTVQMNWNNCPYCGTVLSHE
jgi:uncharacterized membrane protein